MASCAVSQMPVEVDQAVKEMKNLKLDSTNTAPVDQLYVPGTDTLFLLKGHWDRSESQSMFHLDKVLHSRQGQKLIVKCRPVINGRLVDKDLVAKIWLDGSQDSFKRCYNEEAVYAQSASVAEVAPYFGRGYIRSLLPNQSGYAIVMEYRDGRQLNEKSWKKLKPATKKSIETRIKKFSAHLRGMSIGLYIENGVSWLDASHENVLYDHAGDVLTVIDFEDLGKQEWFPASDEILWHRILAGLEEDAEDAPVELSRE